jgi:hypothetical protein
MARKKAGQGGGPAGSRLRYGPTGRAQRVKTGGHQWSDEAEEAFLAHLAETCNVRASVAAVGFTHFTVYRHKKLRPEFAAKWQAVLAHNYDRLEMELVRAAIDSLDGEARFDAERPLARMTIEQAMNLLKLHRAEASGASGGRPGRRPMPRGIEHYRESIRRKVEAIRRAGEGDGAPPAPRPA